MIDMCYHDFQMKRFPTLALVVAMAAAIPAAAQSPIRTWKVETDRPDAIYRCGETATFTVTLLSTNNLSQGFDLRSAADKAILHGIGMTHGYFRKFYDELGAWIREEDRRREVSAK